MNGNDDKIEKYVDIIENLLIKARVNKNLKVALEEIKKALLTRNVKLAADLTAVKSYISGSIDSKDSTFGEDNVYNNKILGFSVYSALDKIHYNLAIITNSIPSGTMILTNSAIYERKKPKFTNPILKMMEEEKMRIKNNVKNFEKL